MPKDKLSQSIIYKGFKKTLIQQFNNDVADHIWKEANMHLIKLEKNYPNITGENKFMILPVAALYQALNDYDKANSLELLKEYGTYVGTKIAKGIHTATSFLGVSKLLWKKMPFLMRQMSSSKKGYTRNIISETNELVGVDILSCPLHDAAKLIGMPEVAQVVCAMDKAYMTGFKYIRYTRTTSVANGDSCCDYRLSYDKNKK